MNTQYDIAIDISFLPTTGGFGTYTAQVLKYFIQHDAERTYLLIENKIPSTIPQYMNRDENWKTRWKEIPSHWHYIQTKRRSRILWMLHDLPRIIQQYRPRIFVSFDNVTVPKPVDFCTNVTTLHDIIPISHPHYCRKRDALLCRWLIGRAIKHSTKIITGSHYSADQIRSHYPQAAEKIAVIEDGVEHERFYPISDRESQAASLAQKYQLYSAKYLLIVTTLSPRRNLKQFIQAFSSYLTRSQDHEVCLVIVGCRGWNDHDIYKTVHTLELEQRIHFLNYVSDEELVSLYQAAYAFVNPSLIEGFGLTVLEGMACGTPVLCSSTTSLGEVSGEAALHFDPINPQSMVQSLYTILKKESVWKEYSLKGLEHAKKYHWEKTAQRIIQLFDTLL